MHLSFAAEDLINEVQAIVRGPKTLTKSYHVPHTAAHNNIPVLYDTPWTPCAFCLGDHVTASVGHAKTGFTLGSNASMMFPCPKTKGRNSMTLDTRGDSEKRCKDRKVLKIGVPLKLGFQHFVDALDPISEKQNVTSYNIDILEEVTWILRPSTSYEYASFSGTYDEFVCKVYLAMYDATVGDATISARQVTVIDFTMPYTESGQIIRSPLSKVVVVIWCFVVLILIQSYTSSLSSILTTKRLRPWVIDLDQLQRSGDFVGYQDDSFVRFFLMNCHNISESRLKAYTTKEEYAAALRKGSKNGGVSAIVGAIPYLTSFLSDNRYKDDFMMLGCIYTTPGFGFTFRLGFPLVQNHSTAILNLPEGVSDSQQEVRCFGTTSVLMGDDTVPDFGSTPLTLQNFSGLFVITGSISTIMILIAIVRLVYAKCTRLRNTDLESARDNSVEEDPRSMQNGLDDNPGPSQQLLHEDGDDNFQGVREGGQNDGGSQPDPVQQNVMHGGITPAGHFQIETNNV
ncbi:glutamate receptor 2.1-like [Triticum dicoccoides]|uniref:glutamate receptor 2.1-like n=1 Tax=Triticum dicoccoides TaxID=85692 RepID=UPI0018911800|nr:glutamate receptor 2.1-like [Triticum dicoccoides]